MFFKIKKKWNSHRLRPCLPICTPNHTHGFTWKPLIQIFLFLSTHFPLLHKEFLDSGFIILLFFSE